MHVSLCKCVALILLQSLAISADLTSATSIQWKVHCRERSNQDHAVSLSLFLCVCVCVCCVCVCVREPCCDGLLLKRTKNLSRQS